MDELKKCPFCGSNAITMYYGSKAVISCENEHCPMMNVDTGDLPLGEAKSHWNNRPLEDALTAKLEIAIRYICKYAYCPNNDLSYPAQQVLDAIAELDEVKNG